MMGFPQLLEPRGGMTGGFFVIGSCWLVFFKCLICCFVLYEKEVERVAIVIGRRTQRLKVQIEEEEGLLCVKKKK